MKPLFTHPVYGKNIPRLCLLRIHIPYYTFWDTHDWGHRPVFKSRKCERCGWVWR